MTCSICYDEHKLIDGFRCSNNCPENRHFTCNACFEQHARISLNDKKFEGNLFCPSKCENSKEITMEELFRHTSSESGIIEKYIKFERNFLNAILQIKKIKNTRKKMDDELERIRQMDELNREVLLSRKHIEEEILTIRCPRCKQAFVDFTGCFALKCSRNNCACAFCAYCLKDCGHDAHAHVRICKIGRQSNTRHGVYFDNEQKFIQVHKTSFKRATNVFK